MRVMISQPMSGKTPEQIEATRQNAERALTARGYTIANNYFAEDWKSAAFINSESEPIHVGVNFLARSIGVLSYCHAVYFCRGWKKARGCRIEHKIAKEYGLICLYEASR